jgi:uncharacterized membrane protein
MIVGLALHILGVVTWVGGLIFSTIVLNIKGPASFEPSTVLVYRNHLFSRIFFWSWAAIVALVASGFVVTFEAFGGFASLPVHVRVMMGLGVLALPIYTYWYFAPWRSFRRAVLDSDWMASERDLKRVRFLIAVLLALGLITAIIGTAGRYYG